LHFGRARREILPRPAKRRENWSGGHNEFKGRHVTSMNSILACNILELIALLKQRAKDERGIELSTEVEVIGDEN
jgi:hypothetical protein